MLSRLGHFWTFQKFRIRLKETVFQKPELKTVWTGDIHSWKVIKNSFIKMCFGTEIEKIPLIIWKSEHLFIVSTVVFSYKTLNQDLHSYCDEFLWDSSYCFKSSCLVLESFPIKKMDKQIITKFQIIKKCLNHFDIENWKLINYRERMSSPRSSC
jgi:hypothetical protein